MKLKFAITAIVCFAMLLIGCEKENAVEINTLYARWKLTEVYDKFGSVWPAMWESVSDADTHYLQFLENGQYKKVESASGQSSQCSGTYKLFPGNKVEINSNCEAETEKLTITELTSDLLIIDRLGTEGVIRYKYKVDK